MGWWSGSCRESKESFTERRWGFEKAPRRPGEGSAGSATLQSKEGNMVQEPGGKFSEVSVWLN